MALALHSTTHLDALTGSASLSRAQHGTVLVVRLDNSRLDAHIAVDAKRQIAAMIDAGHRRLVLDLSRVQFMDSSGLGTIVTVFKLAGLRGDVVLSGVRPQVQDLLDLTRMDRVFRQFPSPKAAVAALNGTVALA